MSDISVKIESSQELGVDYLNRKVFLIKGELNIPNNKKSMKHMLFLKEDNISLQPLYCLTKRLNDGEDIKEQNEKEICDNLTFVLQPKTIDIIMITHKKFIGQSTEHIPEKVIAEIDSNDFDEYSKTAYYPLRRI